LLRSLPGFVVQADCEVIVVDYDCPQDTARVVAEKFPKVRIVKLHDRPGFNPAAARNAGAAVAEGRVLVFLDSDIVVVEDLTTRLAALSPGSYGEFVGPNDVRGSCVIPADAFRALDGYDDVIMGYGCEDLDLYGRLRLAGLEQMVLPIELIREVIPNTAEERIFFNDLGRKLGYARGKAYRDLKILLMKLARSLSLERGLRLELWTAIDEIVRSPEVFETEHYLEVPLPQEQPDAMLPNCQFSPSIRLAIKLAR
jgi:glycosyltransferase involved in cell wall biosynthesis